MEELLVYTIMVWATDAPACYYCGWQYQWAIRILAVPSGPAGQGVIWPRPRGPGSLIPHARQPASPTRHETTVCLPPYPCCTASSQYSSAAISAQPVAAGVAWQQRASDTGRPTACSSLSRAAGCSWYWDRRRALIIRVALLLLDMHATSFLCRPAPARVSSWACDIFYKRAPSLFRILLSLPSSQQQAIAKRTGHGVDGRGHEACLT